MEGSEVGGLHVSHVPGIKVPQEQIVSVNGVGDTFLGVLLARLAEVEKESRRAGKGGGLDGLRDLEEAVDLAQKAAVMTLGVREAVSAEIGSLRR